MDLIIVLNRISFARSVGGLALLNVSQKITMAMVKQKMEKHPVKEQSLGSCRILVSWPRFDGQKISIQNRERERERDEEQLARGAERKRIEERGGNILMF